MSQPHVVVLAAGQGSRMKSQLPKVCHALGGKPMVQHVVETARTLTDRITVVVGHGAEQVQAVLADSGVEFVLQSEQLGTGHAVAQALPNISPDDTVLVLYGDVPLIRQNTLEHLLETAEHDNGLALLTATLEDPTGYGRILRENGQIRAIVEQKDATDEQQAINEVNTGFMAVSGARLHDWLPRLSNDNAQGEYYLTDLVELAVTDGVPVTATNPGALAETQGVNNRAQLAYLERRYQRARAETLMLGGTSLADPARIDLRGTVTAGTDNWIDANVVLKNVTLGSGVSIGPNCVISNSAIEDGARIEAGSIIDGARVGPNALVGPMARLRPGADLADGAKVGNFVEVKKAVIEAGAKVNHLTYVGDARVGKGANIGAGTITCNYDGANKHHTDIGAGAFVGSNSTLVAPVAIGDGAFIGAGSIINRDAPADKLTLARSRQTTIERWQKPVKASKE